MYGIIKCGGNYPSVTCGDRFPDKGSRLVYYLKFDKELMYI